MKLYAVCLALVRLTFTTVWCGILPESTCEPSATLLGRPQFILKRFWCDFTVPGDTPNVDARAENPPDSHQGEHLESSDALSSSHSPPTSTVLPHNYSYPSMTLCIWVCVCFMYNMCVFVLPLTSVDPRYIA